jgi:hypothetical protein
MSSEKVLAAVRPKEKNERIPSVARELIKIGHEWVCSLCGRQFYNAGCVLTGLTLDEIIKHVKTFRERAFAEHICAVPSEE